MKTTYDITHKNTKSEYNYCEYELSKKDLRFIDKWQKRLLKESSDVRVSCFSSSYVKLVVACRDKDDDREMNIASKTLTVWDTAVVMHVEEKYTDEEHQFTINI